MGGSDKETYTDIHSNWPIAGDESVDSVIIQ